ncbi:FCD domain-containing protein [Streptomyces sp. UG1]|uniref:FCD domain-containing protein n=1 Tax=Streptomyces sp. UG1 TaxID=3417652 RepID=UPI003CED5761
MPSPVSHETAHRIIQVLRARTVRQPDLVSLMGDRAESSLCELLEVVEAVAAGDPAAAEASMCQHMTGVVEALRGRAPADTDR